MDMSLQKRLGFGSRALMMGLGVLACCVLAGLLLAESSSAIPPAAGLACKASDGKITGRGSTFNEHSEAFFAQLYEEDICGATPEEGGGPAGNNMVIYNTPSAKAAKNGTGAAAGLAAASCRSDGYAGDASPYSKKQLEELDGKPGTATSGEGCEHYDEKITFPFEPKPGPYPFVEGAKEDIQANAMSFPIAGESLALDVNLPSGACNGKPPTSLDLNATEVSRIFGGNAQTWNDPELVANNSALSNCEGKITRIFRQDSAAQSEILKHYLIAAEPFDGGRPTGAGECAAGKEWSFYLLKKNTEWPGKQSEAGTCSPYKTPVNAGAEEELKLINETSGGVGYADLSDTQAAKDPLIIASVENATNTGYQAPEAGTAANCNFSVLSLPSGGKNGAVGLNAEGDTWANNNQEGTSFTNHENATYQGSRYPICALAFDLVYTGLDDTEGTNNAITRLTSDQRRTLFSYFTFVLSSAAQSRLTSVYYSPLPSAWLPLLSEGFQANF